MPTLLGAPDYSLLPAAYRAILNFSTDGRVRRKGQRAPRLSPGVAESRSYISALDQIIALIHAGLRAALYELIAYPDNWSSAIIENAIGNARSAWATDTATYTALPLHMRADWNFAADFNGINKTALQDTLNVEHTITAGHALFHTSTGVWRIGSEPQPAQPAADNANAWTSFLFGAEVVYPDDVMTLDGETMALGEDMLTF